MENRTDSEFFEHVTDMTEIGNLELVYQTCTHDIEYEYEFIPIYDDVV